MLSIRVRSEPSHGWTKEVFHPIEVGMPMSGTLLFHCVRSLDKAILGSDPALDTAAFKYLLAELYPQMALGAPGDGAKAERDFTF